MMLPSVVEMREFIEWLNKARMRLTTSAAELASRMMRSAVIFARSTFAGSADSHR